jgi:hypothetical protein
MHSWVVVLVRFATLSASLTSSLMPTRIAAWSLGPVDHGLCGGQRRERSPGTHSRNDLGRKLVSRPILPRNLMLVAEYIVIVIKMSHISGLPIWATNSAPGVESWGETGKGPI